MKNVIVGTAGHIDHGKSMLVQALTGVDPDRWAEEKRRGITIDLGFAHLDLPGPGAGDGVRLGFVDVPGHEKFVKNMLAGAGGIDLVLLVIAADESIKPQTREHFDICRLLGVPRGLTVLSKADLVAPDMLDLVRLETEEFLKGSFLEGAPILPVSSRTGQGLERLKQELGRIAATVPGKDTARAFRLPIDRAFVMKGFGTVVTGTLVAGSIGKDEEAELFPDRRRLRVRGVQVHNRPAERAGAGQRTALNLAGVDAGEIERGMVLARPGMFTPTERADAEVLLLPSARPLKHGARAHFHQGTAEMVAEVRFFDREQLKPGEAAYAQLRLRGSTLLLPGDRFILRQFSPVVTIGGGRVLDAQPGRHKRTDPGLPAYFATLARGGREAILEALVKRDPRGALTERDLMGRTGWQPEELREAVESLVRTGRLRRVGPGPVTVVDSARLVELARRTLAALEAFHKKEPLLEGVPKGELKGRASRRASEAMFEAVLKELASRGEVEVAGDTVKRAGRTIRLTPEEEEARRVIENAFIQAGLAVPSVKEVLVRTRVEPKRAQKIVLILLREKVLVKVTEDLLFHHTALERLREMLQEYKRRKSERINVPGFKELTGVTRKYAIPLLEYLDRQRVTRRAGDERQILL